MRYTENDLKVGTKLRCTKAEPVWWTVGKVYDVSLREDGVLIIIDDNGHSAYMDYVLYCLNGKHNPVAFEIIKEEKEMQKYAKITKYAGFDGMDERKGLEIGKTYKIVSYEDVFTDDCRIYLNDKHPRYFISETQYELVEKEYPVADVKADVKEAIQAKIDELRNEAEHLFKKRDRLEQHGINLNKKAQKLKEVIETIKEFE